MRYSMMRHTLAKLMTIILSVTILSWTAQSCFAVTKKHTKTTTTHHSVKKTKKKTPVVKHTNKKPLHKKTVTKKKVTTKKKKVIRHPVHAKPAARASTRVNTSNLNQSNLPGYLLNSVEKTLVSFVQDTVSTISYTSYKLGGTKIDSSRGVYVVDCSTYVDHILKSVYPRAYTSLTSWSGTEKPTTDDFYQYFKNLSDNSRHWNTIDDVEQLRPGDILVFRSKNKYGNETGGHVMVVMDKPIQDGDTFLVRIADSAPSGHSKDTRFPHASGIGIGTMLLKVNPRTSHPYAYAWKVGARWESNVNFAMARPVNMNG